MISSDHNSSAKKCLSHIVVPVSGWKSTVTIIWQARMPKTEVLKNKDTDCLSCQVIVKPLGIDQSWQYDLIIKSDKINTKAFL